MLSRSEIRRTSGARLQSTLYDSGLLDLVAAAMRRQGAVVLMYHSVAAREQHRWIDPANLIAPEAFRQQMEYLATHRTVVSLSQLVERVGSGQSPDRGTVVLTFDDGYLDNLTVAAPILKDLNLPATLFVPSGYVERAENQWIDSVCSIFRHRRRQEILDIPVPGNRFDLRKKEDYERAYREVCSALLAASYPERTEMLQEFQEMLAPTDLPERLTMSWDDVRRLQTEFPGFEVGGHTVDHLDMTTLSPERAAQELRACREQIAENTGRLPRHFSFPYGRNTEKLRQLAQRAGFESCCGSSGDPRIRANTDLLGLQRVAPPRTLRQFRFLTSVSNTGWLARLTR